MWNHYNLFKIYISFTVQRDLPAEILPATTIATRAPTESIATNGTRFYLDKERDNTAQPAIPKSPLGVPVYWESGANPASE